MDAIWNIILIALVAWHVLLGVALLGYFSWAALIEPAWKLALRLKPVPPTQPMVDLRQRT